ncbi:MAG TPA: hypothetical protein VNO82_18950, partial [Solirubrobacteraceae bacterium]|nr:hypothetical protein [Solirubrobacteraceae bacterium]
LVAFAATAGTAHAGGWATVQLGAPAPKSLDSGEPWRVELIVKQHGITPLDGVTPSVEITGEAGAVRKFEARPTGRPGTYVAEVTYPSAGTWKTRIYDGFTDAVPHRLSPMTVAPALGTATAASDGGFPWPQAVAVALVALLFLGGILATLGLPRPRLGTVTLRGRAA